MEAFFIGALPLAKGWYSRKGFAGFPSRGRCESRPLRLKRLLFMEAFFDGAHTIKNSRKSNVREDDRKYLNDYFALRLIKYAIASAICCWVRASESPHGGIEIEGFGPEGVEPCWMNKSRL
jgi:hypothetical protein